jgi:hypothetical protein
MTDAAHSEDALSSGAILRRESIKPGTPDPYTPPKPGELRPEEHLQIGAVTQYVTSLVKSHDDLPEPHHGIGHTAG